MFSHDIINEEKRIARTYILFELHSSLDQLRTPAYFHQITHSAADRTLGHRRHGKSTLHWRKHCVWWRTTNQQIWSVLQRNLGG